MKTTQKGKLFESKQSKMFPYNLPPAHSCSPVRCDWRERQHLDTAGKNTSTKTYWGGKKNWQEGGAPDWTKMGVKNWKLGQKAWQNLGLGNRNSQAKGLGKVQDEWEEKTRCHFGTATSWPHKGIQDLQTSTHFCIQQLLRTTTHSTCLFILQCSYIQIVLFENQTLLKPTSSSPKS